MRLAQDAVADQFLDLFPLRCSLATNTGILRYAQEDDEKRETAATPAGKRASEGLLIRSSPEEHGFRCAASVFDYAVPAPATRSRPLRIASVGASVPLTVKGRFESGPLYFLINARLTATNNSTDCSELPSRQLRGRMNSRSLPGIDFRQPWRNRYLPANSPAR